MGYKYNDGNSREHMKTAKKDSVRLLTIIQITGCAIVLAAALCLKYYGGKMYGTVRDWYLSAYNDTIIADEQTKNIKHTVVDLWSSIAGKSSASAFAQSSSSKKPQPSPKAESK